MTPFKSIMKGIYGGNKLYKTVCKNCGAISTRDELFYNLSLKVKNLCHIHESLSQYIKEEFISDFKCESCEKKVEISRRCTLASMPNVLIIHLQRLVYNLETFQNEKINSKLEFPHQLNLEPFSSEGLDWREK
jgi:ubiquitin carboxyl-terminal hydrolase 34